MNKICGRCYRSLPLTSFHNDKSKDDGKMTTCKDCRKGKTGAPAIPDGWRICRICGEAKPIIGGFYTCTTATRKTCIQCCDKRWKTNYRNKTGRIGSGKASLLGFLGNTANKSLLRSNPSYRERERQADKKYASSEKGKAKREQWAEDHKHKRVYYNHVRDARKANLEASFTPEQWEITLDAFDHKCAYCGTPLTKPVQEHYIPVVKGGPYKMGNIVPACHSCNSKKRTKLPHEFLDKKSRYEIEKLLRGLQ